LSTFILLILTALLLALPTGLRYFTAWKMRQMRATARSCGEELQVLREKLNSLLEECRQTEREQRHCALRQSRLQVQIEEARGELQRLRQPKVGRLAA